MSVVTCVLCEYKQSIVRCLRSSTVTYRKSLYNTNLYNSNVYITRLLHTTAPKCASNHAAHTSHAESDTAIDPLQPVIKSLYKQLVQWTRNIDNRIHWNLYSAVLQNIITDLQQSIDVEADNKSIQHTTQSITALCSALQQQIDNKSTHSIQWTNMLQRIFKQYITLPNKSTKQSKQHILPSVTIQQRSQLIQLLFALLKHVNTNQWQYAILYKSQYAYDAWQQSMSNDRLGSTYGSIVIVTLYSTNKNMKHSERTVHAAIEQLVNDTQFLIHKHEESSQQRLEQFEKLVLLNQVFFEQHKYKSPDLDTQSPSIDTCLLSKVIENKVGSSATLCSLYISVARRIGLHNIMTVLLSQHTMCKLVLDTESLDTYNGALKTDKRIVSLLNQMNKTRKISARAAEQYFRSTKQRNGSNGDNDTVTPLHVLSAIDIFIDVSKGGILFAKSAVKTENAHKHISESQQRDTTSSNKYSSTINRITFPVKQALLGHKSKYNGSIDELSTYPPIELRGRPDTSLYGRQIHEIILHTLHSGHDMLCQFFVKQLEIIDVDTANRAKKQITEFKKISIKERSGSSPSGRYLVLIPLFSSDDTDNNNDE